MPRIELVTSRDPDSSSDFRIFVDGVEIDGYEIYSTDPGAGYLASDWFDSFNHDYEQASSEAVKQAVTAIYVDGYNSEYIESKPEDDDHSGEIERLCAEMLRNVPDAVGLVLMRDKSEPCMWAFEVGYRLIDVRLSGGRSLSDVDPDKLATCYDRSHWNSPALESIPWADEAIGTETFEVAEVAIPAELIEDAAVAR